MIKTTLYGDRNFLRAAMDLSGLKSYTRVINAALEEFVRRKRLERLAASLGKVDLALDDRALEESRRDE